MPLYTNNRFIDQLEEQESGRDGRTLFSRVRADGFADELLAILGVVELNLGVVECALGRETHADEVADACRALVAIPHRCMDTLKQGPVAGVLVDEADSKPCSHATDCSLQWHKCTSRIALLWAVHGATLQRASKTYNTVALKVVTKRSSPFLGNVPGDVPGCRLGLARFAKVTMRRYASPKQIVDGRLEYEQSAVAGGVAA